MAKNCFFQASVDAIREFLGVYAVAFGSKFDTVHPGQGLSFERIFVPVTRTSLFNRSLDVVHVGAGPNVSCGITAKSWAIFAFNISISFSWDLIKPNSTQNIYFILI